MKLSVSAWCVEKDLFGKKTNLYEFIDFCKKSGVDAVELLDCFWEDENQHVKIKEYLNKINMPVSAYSIANDFVNGDETRKKEIEKVKKGVDMAVFLGARYLRVFSGNSKEGISFDQARAWIIECFKECAEYAGKKGVTMVLENHGLFAGKSSQVKGIIDDVNSKYLRSNADTGNFMLVNENSFEAIKNLKGYVSFIHFKDFQKVDEGGYAAIDGTRYKGTIIGRGEVQLKEIVGFLDSCGYGGFLSIEYEGGGDPYQETLESVKYTRSIIM